VIDDDDDLDLDDADRLLTARQLGARFDCAEGFFQRCIDCGDLTPENQGSHRRPLVRLGDAIVFMAERRAFFAAKRAELDARVARERERYAAPRPGGGS
jgi:hypothetical protein